MNYDWAKTADLDRWISKRQKANGKLNFRRLEGDPETDMFFGFAFAITAAVVILTLAGFALADAEGTKAHILTTIILAFIPGLLALGLGCGVVSSRISDYRTYKSEVQEAQTRPDSEYYGVSS